MNDDYIYRKCCVRISKDNIIDSFDKLSFSSSIAKNTCTFSDHMEAIWSIDSKSVLFSYIDSQPISFIENFFTEYFNDPPQWYSSKAGKLEDFPLLHNC